MNITLAFNNFEESLVLPVVPEEIAVNTGLKNETLDIVGLGEVGVIGNRKLNTITISSFFPREYCSYCETADFLPPYEAAAKIEKWRDSKRPIRLIISQYIIRKQESLTLPSILNMPCMIEEFGYREKGGQPGDVYYDLSLKEYRFIQAREVKEVLGGRLEITHGRPDERQIPDKHIVKEGECLYIIAKRYYQDGEKWRELYEKNKHIIGGNPDLIYPGWELQL